ncbi:IS30 family transposase [Nocardiopsis composta]|uniref:IS30 family transposase n=1 Tax=Nocardiopsis composta TaxID=157465 RepID=A0A7W8VC55_9ACTN|nr:IS30 family transposase [Nocardiopsis composta]
MRQGLSSVEACRILGINRRTGRRWRTGRARRRPRRRTRQRTPRFSTPMVMIGDRPAEAADRALPGHWEGDPIIGKGGASAIGTLVERATRYVMLLHLPEGRSAEHVRDALVETVQILPAHLVRSLTWGQGAEMAARGSFTLATDIPVYFCGPAGPWQRGSNENIYWCTLGRAGLLRRETLRQGRRVTQRTRVRRTFRWHVPGAPQSGSPGRE